MLLFEDKLPLEPIRSAIVRKVRAVSADLGIDPNWLMGVMHLETKGTFNPAITNSIGATGLIQFMPSTARALGTSTWALRQMSFTQQLDWVKKYYWPYRHKINSYVDLYLATLFPVALGKNKNFVLRSRNLSADTVARNNPLFDLNNDRQITIQEIERKLLSRLPLEFVNRMKNSPKMQGALVVLAIAGTAYIGHRQNWWSKIYKNVGR